MAFNFSRRKALLSTLAAPVALGAAKRVNATQAGQKDLLMTRARGFRLGDMQVTTLLSATALREDPQKIFGLNVDAGEFETVSRENFIPTDAAQFFFTPTLVMTEDKAVLFDTGLNPGGITSALAEAGYAPDDITHVVLTHMHGDHIGGLMHDGKETFPNAIYLTGQVEFDHWAAAGNEGFDAKVKPLADKFSFLSDGGTVASGITAIDAAGHTPGHMNYMLESGGKQMLLMADLANHYVWSLAYPDWEVRFDMDKAAAAATRRRILGMVAADSVPVVGYHMPFPAAGYIETRGDGFRYVPVSYQLM